MEDSTVKPRPERHTDNLEDRSAGKASQPLIIKPSEPNVLALVDALYSSVKERIVLRTVSAGSLMNLVTTVMTLVEKQKSLTGPEKKEVVAHLVEKIIDEIPCGEEDKRALQSAIQFLLHPMIDTIIAATRGQLDLNKDGIISSDEIISAAAGCWGACFPCCRSRTRVADSSNLR